jgi:hypothetical protein
MSDADPEELAQELTDLAGLPPPSGLERLGGGKNNRVFAVTLGDGRKVVLKSYHYDPRDPRDRLGAEWDFLTYVWDRGVRNVPEPLATLPESHAGLYGFVEGIRPSDVREDLVLAAAGFVTAINANPDLGRLKPGSEASFSIADHLATVARRVARLNQLDETAPHIEEARELVENRLKPAWAAVEKTIREAAAVRSEPLGAPIGREIVSPSDFGFHNALVADGAVTFIDFEYAGRDDPAKLVCDFFCQPEVPVPLVHLDPFVAAIGLDEREIWRSKLLLDAFRCKWCCISMNEFSSVGAGRRAFANSAEDRAERARRHLQRAESQLSNWNS